MDDRKRVRAIIVLALTLAGSETLFNLQGHAVASASFELSGLTVEPTQIEPNCITVISVNVSNIGETIGAYDLELKMNGTIVDSKRVQLEGDSEESVSFNVTRSYPGIYNVIIGSLTGTLKVLKPTQNSILTIDEAIMLCGLSFSGFDSTHLFPFPLIGSPAYCTVTPSPSAPSRCLPCPSRGCAHRKAS